MIYKKIIEKIKDCVYIIDKNDNFEYVNKFMAWLIGDNQRDIVNKPRSACLDKITLESQSSLIEKVFTSKDAVKGETLNIFQGREFWMDNSFVPIKNRCGEIVSVLCISRDITQRKSAEESLLFQKTLFQQLFRNAPFGIVMIDENSKIIQINSAFERIFGYKPAEALGEKLDNLVVPDFKIHEGKGISARHVMGDVVDLETVRKRKDGTLIDIRIMTVPVMIDGKFSAGYCIYDDISARKQNETMLRLTSEVFLSALEGIVVTDANGYIVVANPFSFAITGYSTKELIGKNVRRFISKRNIPGLIREIYSQLLNTGHWNGEIWTYLKNRQDLPQLVTISPIQNDDGEIIQFVIISRDLTERKRYEEQIKYQAYHDALTGLPNRLFLKDKLESYIKTSKKHPKKIGVMLLDLDDFKTINDTFGHDTGDIYLKSVSDKLKSILKTGDTIARMGGDEFTIVAPGIEVNSDVEKIAHKIRESLREGIDIEGEHFTITASIGISTFPDNGADYKTLMRNADTAMYKAKKMGKNGFCFAEDSGKCEILTE